MTFTILGPPRTKKTHQRVIRVRGSIRVIPSAANMDWTRVAVLQLQAALVRAGDAAVRAGTVGDLPVLPIRQATNCRAIVYRDANRGDLIGYLQAIADALEAAGVVENDRLVVAWDGSRMLVDKARPRVELELTPVDG